MHHIITRICSAQVEIEKKEHDEIIFYYVVVVGGLHRQRDWTWCDGAYVRIGVGYGLLVIAWRSC